MIKKNEISVAARAMPRFRKVDSIPETDEDPGTVSGKRPSHARVSTVSFQEKFLNSKLKKETGLADQAEIEATIAKIELAERTGKLLTMAKAQDMLEKEHLIWLKEIEGLPQDITRRLHKKGIPIDVMEQLKDACEESCVALRKRLSRG